MKLLLLVLIISAAINTACAIYNGFMGASPITPGERVVDAIWTAGIGCWALWLFASKDWQ